MRTTVHVEHGEGVDPFGYRQTRPTRNRFREFINTLKGVIGDGAVASRGTLRPSAIAGTALATGTITALGVQAGDTVTLNGQVLTAVAGAAAANQFSIDGNDAADATALVAAINATTQTLISGVLAANNLAATITLASVTEGQYVDVGGVRFKAVNGPSTTDTFTIAGTDTADAAALVTCINAHPALKDRVLATSAAGVVTVRQLPRVAAAATLEKSGAGITLSGGVLAATSVVLVTARTKGAQGNANTLASSDGTRLAVSGARLTGGTQETFTF